MTCHHLSKNYLRKIITLSQYKLKILATETYKFLQGLTPPLMNEIFVERNNNYSFQGNNILTR